MAAPAAAASPLPAAPHNSYLLETPVFRPTKEEFARPFCEYVNKVLKKNPDIAMFKVVPPPGWKPRRTPIRLSKLDITCPIKQHAYGTKGQYRAILVEAKTLNADQFKAIAEDEEHAPPKKVRDGEDRLLERNFWNSVTINPPLYGADTPMSLFDEKLSYGWNLRHLDGCLLKSPDVPQVPGVTSPMVYFGMWRSFFAWHVEDADLFSINYLHFGAPKVWYCVSPSQRAKFERMCQSIFPELHKDCKAFMRHKDILLSPNLLRTYGIEYMQARQEPNEFIVLNAAAYHAGYNMGFNCAEAVNFAPESWIDIGRNVVRCKCRDDGVRLSMRMFGCSSGSSATDSEDDDGSSSGDEDGSGSGSGRSSGEEEEEEEQEVSSNGEEEEEEQQEQEQPRGRGARSGSRAAAARRVRSRDGSADAAPPRSKRGAAAAAAAAAAAEGPSSSKRARLGADALSPGLPLRRGPRQTRTSLAAAAASKRARTTHASAEARARLSVQRGRAGKRRDSGGSAAPAAGGGSRDRKGSSSSRSHKKRGTLRTGDLEDSLQRAAAAAAAIRARLEQQKQQAASQQALAAAPPAAAAASAGDEQQPRQQRQRSTSGSRFLASLWG